MICRSAPDIFFKANLTVKSENMKKPATGENFEKLTFILVILLEF